MPRPRSQKMRFSPDFPEHFRAAVQDLPLYDHDEELPFDTWCWHWIHVDWHIVKRFNFKDPNFTTCLHVIKMTPMGGARIKRFALGHGTVAFTPKQGGVVKAMEVADAWDVRNGVRS